MVGFANRSPPAGYDTRSASTARNARTSRPRPAPASIRRPAGGSPPEPDGERPALLPRWSGCRTGPIEQDRPVAISQGRPSNLVERGHDDPLGPAERPYRLELAVTNAVVDRPPRNAEYLRGVLDRDAAPDLRLERLRLRGMLDWLHGELNSLFPYRPRRAWRS